MFTKQRIIRFIFTSFMVTSLFFSSLGTTSVYAAGITINTAVDETNTNGFCSLREAIVNANVDAASYPDCAAGFGTDTITFAGNYTITLVGAQLPFVASEIIIKGNGATNTIIQANANPNTATYRIFQVGYYGITPGNLTLDSLTVRHGRCFGLCGGRGFNAGGAIYSEFGSTLTILNSSISGNYAGAGGGIYSDNESNLTLTNSSISGNSASDEGGGIYLGGAGTITNSTISGNSATHGGGLRILPDAILQNAPLRTITGTTISGNTASEDGGGVYNENYSLTMTNSTISENTATYDGGGVYNSGIAKILISSSTLSGNFAGTGGAINNDGLMWLGNTTISGNEAYDYGGGIYSAGAGTTRIHYSTIAFNTLIVGTTFGAGGIDGNVTLFNSIVAGNTRAITSEYRDCSGSLSLYGLSLFYDVTNCTFIGTGQAGYFGPLDSLGPLQDNGGSTWTHALFPGSYAIDTGDNTLCADYPTYNLDQRGVTRPQGSQCDVGAFEWKTVSDNVAPADILLNASTISENLPAGTTVGTLTAIDPDTGDTHTYSFCGGADDTFFSLAGDALHTTAIFDFEVQGTFNICLRATDAADMSFEKAFEIFVLDEAENPAPETTIIRLNVNKPRKISIYKFVFTSSISDSTFMCRLDQEAFSPCKNPTSYSGLSTGLHTFQVYAIDPSGNPDLTPAEYSFTVDE